MAVATGFTRRNPDPLRAADRARGGELPDVVDDARRLKKTNRFGGSNYAGVQSVLGLGLTAQLSTVEFLDPRYFTSGTFPRLFFNGTNTTPFGSTEPALALTGRNGGSFLSIAADVGSVNGQNGRDILIQMDGNLFAVPEPSSLILCGLGLAGLLVLRTRKLVGEHPPSSRDAV